MPSNQEALQMKGQYKKSSKNSLLNNSLILDNEKDPTL